MTMPENSQVIRKTVIYWLLIFAYIALPLVISVAIEQDRHLVKRLIYTLIAALGLLLPFALLRPGWHKWLVLLYTPFYLVYWLDLCHFYILKTHLLGTSIQIILDSNTQEVKEFILRFGNGKSFISGLLYLLAVVLFFIIIKRQTAPKNRNWKLIAACLIALLFSISKGFHTLVFDRYQLLPYRIIDTYISYYQDLRELIKLQQEHKIPQMAGLHSEFDSQTPETYLVIIGESVDKNHLGYYGYSRPTTPFSDKLIKPYVFRNVRAPHASTLLSIRDSLTFAHHDYVRPGLREGSLINIFAQAGFKTFWLSNQYSQGKFDNLTSVLAHDAQVPMFINDQKDLFLKKVTDSHFDEDLLPHLDNILQDKATKKIVFIHLAGSHTPYSFRFPKSFDVFTGNDTNAFERDFDDYDNSLRYTDYVLSQMAERVAKLSEQSFMLYFSDHGDDVYLQPNSCHCHTTNPAQQTNAMFEIPFLLWMNASYKQANPAIVKVLPDYLNRRFINHHLIHSLPTLAGLSFSKQQNDKNLFSPRFVPEQ